MTQSALRGSTMEGGAPPFDRAAVSVLARRVELQSIQLVELAFTDLDSDSALGADQLSPESTTSVGLSVTWELAPDLESLGVLVHASFDVSPPESDEEAVHIDGTYRVLYAVGPGDEMVTAEHADQFAHWNVVFNVWPFWREVAAGILQRSRHTPVLVPLFRMPQ